MYSRLYVKLACKGLQRPVCLAQNRIVKYGYARVSTEDQNASMQRTALKKFGCEKIFTDDGQIRRDDKPGRIPTPSDCDRNAEIFTPARSKFYVTKRKRLRKNKHLNYG